ncbi:MAG: hypothetical protein L0L26_01275 [Corynebacterium variabile]|uniref:hypothetical protein n=1 Tax=Corynebacterium variabile TaxID=1727 RepID=UPI0026473BAA|nr:hypothetical protein [Corynebacterium variabile]MDN6660486.1 hypothetical protein [Corynebacterium variabile]
MSRTLSFATAMLTAAALSVSACSSDDSDDAQEVVTVTATAEGGPSVQDDGPDPAGPDPTGAGSAPAADPSPGQQSSPEPADNNGTITLTGNVVETTAGELMDGGRTPNGEPTSELHIILQLNGPHQIEAKKSGSPGTWEETVTQVSLATPNGSLSSIDWDSYVGQEVTVTTTSEDLWFPSDTGLPLGMVRLNEGTVH